MLKVFFCSKGTWGQLLEEEFEKPYMRRLEAFLTAEMKAGETVYPPMHQVFQAFHQTPYEKVSVVIVGQDPYHGPGQAHGLAFSVAEGIKPPPSLVNIFKEIEQDLEGPRPQSGSLNHWADQGVFLLNTTLTVRARQAKSHADQGWELFTDQVIQRLSERKDPLVFVLWGQSACQKCAFLKKEEGAHLILTAAHPSPFSAYHGFLGCRHFSQINTFLKDQNKPPIKWVSQSA